MGRVTAALALVSFVPAACGQWREYFTDNVEVAPFGDVACSNFRYIHACSCATPVKGSSVHIEACRPGDSLAVAAGLRGGVTGAYDAAACRVTYTGEADVAVYTAAIAATKFVTTATDYEERVVRYVLGNGIYSDETGHFFEYFPFSAIGGSSSWVDAQAHCALQANDIFGLAGYLATIATEAEHNFVLANYPQAAGWIGATDSSMEGEWFWVTGPEGCRGDDATFDYDRMGYARTACEMGDMEAVADKKDKCKVSRVTFKQECKGPCYAAGGTECRKGTKFGWVEECGVSCFKFNYYARMFHHFEAGVRPNDKQGPVGSDFLYWEPGEWVDYPIGGDGGSMAGFTCEWGGLGELCIDERDLYANATLYHWLDECAVDAPVGPATCRGGAPPQACEDPNTDGAVRDDWTCVCPPPTAGTATAAAADCQLNECTDGGGVDCIAADQTCDDTRNQSAASLNDYVCACKAPLHGDAVGGAAGCELDECVNGTGVECVAAGQECNDPDTDPAATLNFVCTCKAPSVGTGTGEPAVCPLDECVAGGGKDCVAAGQDCVDGDHSPDELNGYKCSCRAPQTGEATGAVAACTLDECVYGEGAKCAAAGQACEDQLNGASSLGDFVCACAAPLDFKKETGGVVDCHHDECIDHEATCHMAAQACFDGDKAVLGDWVCYCVAPQTGANGTAGPALCVDPPGDCDGGHLGAVCHTVGQGCVDVAAPYDGEFECHCNAPSVGANVLKGPAACVLDECNATCSSCENDACPAPRQTCVDPNTTYTATRDWRCECVAPYSGRLDGAPAACEIDECVAECNHCARTTCSDADQSCEDGDDLTDGDWACICAPPAVGRVVAEAAACELDECSLSPHNATCTNEGQECRDRDVSAKSRDDWTCVCVSPWTGVANMTPAACTWDECADLGAACVKAGQTCIDADDTIPGNWACHCNAPASGERLGAPAACGMDECYVDCGTCAGDACTNANQTCYDPDPTEGATGDWMCNCTAPAADALLGGPATCHVDECLVTDVLCATCARDTCTNRSQTCVDPNPLQSSPGDWLCQCKAPLRGAANARAANCTIDECEVNCPGRCANGACVKTVCTPQGCTDAQTCTDPDHSEFAVRDWMCQCVLPAVGVRVAALAECIIDECNATCFSCEKGACADANQTCHDPDPHAESIGDWLCLCALPSVDNATAAAATCTVDECAVPCASCANSTCADRLQLCRDAAPMLASLGDWTCECAAPLNGSAVAAAASCTIDECAGTCGGCANGACGVENQTCVDGDVGEFARGDWVCGCVSPAVGNATAAVALCVIDECAAECATCAQGAWTVGPGWWEAGQVCHDPNRSSKKLGDWTCTCPRPTSGAAVAGQAACVTDECAVDCGTCANGTCVDAGQVCEDRNTSAAASADWVCSCVAPRNGSAVAGAAGCALEECGRRCDTCAGRTCSDAGQACLDLNISDQVLGDWICLCPTPSIGNATQAAAACVLHECDTPGCRTCANSTCAARNQTCADPNPSAASLSDWQCRCVAPLSGSAEARAAACFVNECGVPNCTTCAGATCASKGQSCYDPNDAAESLNDWMCSCVLPFFGANSTLTHTECSVDECTAWGCATCANSTCIAAGQDCLDPFQSEYSLADWSCLCVSPQTGSAVGGVAGCELDECTADCTTCAGTTCADAGGQLCEEGSLHPSAAGDWSCVCPAPALGSRATGRPANCTLDECLAANCAGSVSDCPPTLCEAHGQTCVDGDVALEALGTWTCDCTAPYLGSTPRSYATCVIDECDVPCPTCANGTCLEANQSCAEGYAEVFSDWVCVCAAPAVGAPARAAPAVCELDECVAACATCADGACEAKAQQCRDPDLHQERTWRCECPSPAEGVAVGAPASCLLNECAHDASECSTCAGATCTAASQLCEDANTADSLADWVCRCPPPSAGTAVAGKVATCPLDECATARAVCPTCEGGLCRRHGQECIDPDATHVATNDWLCRCVAPAVGAVQVAAAAACLLNECSAACAHCAGAVCSAANQSCVDPNPVAESPGDWYCVCPPPSEGEAVGAAAVLCRLDECASSQSCATCEKSVCGGAGQLCEDPTPSLEALGDWRCVCAAPASGWAEAAPAVCVVDECVVGCATCENNACGAAGQTCVDADTAAAARADWACACRLPEFGRRTGGAAACSTLYDECNEACAGCANGACARGGQVCADPAPSYISQGDWTCRCRAPAAGHAALGVAVCQINECTERCSTCENAACGAAQECVDPDTSEGAAGDWYCACVAPAYGAAVTAGRAACRIDECAADCGTCSGGVCSAAGQTCKDHDLSAGSLGDWTCACAPPLWGQERAAAATCYIDECAERACASCANGTCTAAGQACQDPDVLSTARYDWTCTCPSPTTGVAVRAAARCELDECVVACPHCSNGTCTAADQTCHDADAAPASRGDWVCRCKDLSGSADGAVAGCALDECNAACATCEKGVCAAGHQRCVDPAPRDDSLSDWACECPPPSHGPGTRAEDFHAAGSLAPCVLDECAEDCASCANGACAAANQTCADPTPTVDHYGDWACTCLPPAQGRHVGYAALCILDECAADCPSCAGDVCEDAQQRCRDERPATLNDWVCACRNRHYVTAVRAPVASCDFEAPPTQMPGTFIPPTFAPAVGAVHDPTPPPETVTPTPMSLVNVVTSVSTLSPHVLAASQASALLLPCLRHHGDMQLPFALNPTGAELDGSQYAGAIAGNTAIVAAAFLIGTVLAVLSWMASDGFRMRLSCMDYLGVAAVPSSGLFVFQWLFMSLALSAWALVLYPASSAMGLLGGAALVALAAVPAASVLILTKAVRRGAVYAIDAEIAHGPSKARLWLFGPGEWVSLRSDHYVPHKFACLLRHAKDNVYWWSAAEAGCAFAVALAAAFHTTTWAQCGHVKLAQCAAYAALFGACVYRNPYHRRRDSFLMSAFYGIQGFGCFVMALGYYIQQEYGALYDMAAAVILIGMVLLFVKMVLDLLCELHLWSTGRRVALQRRTLEAEAGRGGPAKVAAAGGLLEAEHAPEMVELVEDLPVSPRTLTPRGSRFELVSTESLSPRGPVPSQRSVLDWDAASCQTGGSFALPSSQPGTSPPQTPAGGARPAAPEGLVSLVSAAPLPPSRYPRAPLASHASRAPSSSPSFSPRLAPESHAGSFRAFGRGADGGPPSPRRASRQASGLSAVPI